MRPRELGPAQEPTQPPVPWIPRASFSEIKWPELEVFHSPPLADVWIYASTPIRILGVPGTTLLLRDCCNVLCILRDTLFRISLAKNFDILRRASRLPTDNSCCRVLCEWLRTMRLFCALKSWVRDNCTSIFVYWLRTLFSTSFVPKLLRLAECLEAIGFLRGTHARPMFFIPSFEIPKTLLGGNAILWITLDGFCIRDEKVNGVEPSIVYRLRTLLFSKSRGKLCWT